MPVDKRILIPDRATNKSSALIAAITVATKLGKQSAGWLHHPGRRLGYGELDQLNDFTAAANGLVRSAGVVTVTTTNSNVNTHPFRRGGQVIIAGAADPSFNGTFFVFQDIDHQRFRFVQAGTDASSGNGSATAPLSGAAAAQPSPAARSMTALRFPRLIAAIFFSAITFPAQGMRATLDAQNNVTSADLS